MTFTKERNILIASLSSVGHIHACIGLAKSLQKCGHRIAFLLEKSFQNYVKPLGFIEFLYDTEASIKFNLPAEEISQLLVNISIIGEQDRLKQMEKMIRLVDSDYSCSHLIQCNEKLKQIKSEFQPELFLVDNTTLLPEIYYSNIPWIYVCSLVPLFHLGECFDNLPPYFSGLSRNSKKSDWIRYQELRDRFARSSLQNDLIESMGYKRYKDDILLPRTYSLAVYAFPQEYNFPEIETLDKCYNVDVFNKNESKEVMELKNLVPISFYNDDLDGKWSGKWIYVSMGSMGSVDLKLMNRLKNILSKTNHKYIVSKGPKHREYHLSKNMWGDRFLPQTKIIPLMDLVITHGGNNTVTETFAQGIKMIVMPLFADQFDNATILSESHFAIQLDPFTMTEQDLIDSIEQILADDLLHKRLRQASERIKSEDRHTIFCEKVEQIMNDYDRSVMKL
ncbi:UDP-glucuronosyltransferase 2B23 [Sarcoptes scabiei]|uniref:UDP-glucuronosyltransferase 2B23 n=1 Tax=Sarcoptes scabiei TaxID=52283 RepID=A0A834VE50_SARSC|nr:UDP-glucuronosyltransferase 2B23 [Sarcoptes scabiei]